MNELKIFENPDFGTVRTLVIGDVPYLVGKDVADVLGYSNSRDALARHVDDEDKTIVVIPDTGSNYKSKAILINESGLYSLVLSSKLPTAKKFKRWVTSEVLPSIRKHGAYITAEEQRSEYIARLEAEAKMNRAIAMRINAENRRMKMLLNHPKIQKLSAPALETMALKTFEQATGQDVGSVLPEVEETFSATQVGEMLGGISANKIGKTANAHGLKTEEYGVFVMDKSRYSSKEVTSFRYNRKGVEKLAEILGVEVKANAAITVVRGGENRVHT